MARSRNIKPGFFKNEVLGVADPLYSLLFEGLWVLADRAGKLEDRPLRIKAEIFPYRDGIDTDAILEWLQANGFIRRYEVGGKRYIMVLEFMKHQNPHKNESESELPDPDPIGGTSEKIGTASEILGSTRADSLSSDSLSSDSLHSGADAPAGQPAKPPDPAKPPPDPVKQEIWDAGRSLLLTARMPAKQVGSFLGKLVQDYTAPVVLDAVRAAVKEQPADPAEYMKACCLRASGRRLTPVVKGGGKVAEFNAGLDSMLRDLDQNPDQPTTPGDSHDQSAIDVPSRIVG